MKNIAENNELYDLIPVEESPKQQEESTSGWIGRGIARTGARAGESLLGLPGDVAHSVYDIGNYVSGGIIPNTEQVKEFSKDHPIIATLISPLTAPAFLPGSEQIKEAHEPFTGEYFKPKNPGEKFYDTIVGDMSAILAPELALEKGIKTGVGLAKTAGTALLKSVSGNVAGKVVESQGGGPTASAIAKLTAMTLPFGSQGRIKNSYENSYAQAKNSIKSHETHFKKPIEVPLTGFQKQLDSIKNSVSGHKDKKVVNDLISDLRESLGNQSDLSQLVETKRNINSFSGAPIPKVIKHKIGEIGDMVGKKIQEYGKEIPGFLDNYNNAQSLFGEYAQADKLINTIKESAKKGSPVWKVLGAVPGVASLGYTGYLPIAAGAGAIGYGGLEAAKMFNLLKNSPQARGIYGNMYKHASAGASTALARDVRALNKMLDKQDIKYTLEPVD